MNEQHSAEDPAERIDRVLNETWDEEARGREGKEARDKSAAAVKAELDQWSNASILTRPWKIALLCVLAGFFAAALLLWFSASDELVAKIQTFNGAMTIPVGGLTWAFSFTFVFLVPMKAMQILMCKVMKYNIEVSERMLDVLESAQGEVHERAERMEGRYNKTMDRVDKAVAESENGKHPMLERIITIFKEEMGELKREIREARDGTEDELEAALAAGEAEAAKITGPTEIDFEVLYEVAPWPSEQQRFPVRAETEHEAYRLATHNLCFKHGVENVRFPKKGAVIRAGE